MPPHNLNSVVQNFDYSTANTAEDVFRIVKRSNPELWADLIAAYPVTDSPDDDWRHWHGYRRPHRNKGVAKRVPKEHRRIFSPEEWAQLQVLRESEIREMRLTYALANELAQEGM